MSKGFVEKLFNQRLLGIANKSLRSDIEAQPGQVLILENLNEFNKVLTNKLNVKKLTEKQTEAILVKAKAKALELHNEFVTNNPKRLKVTEKKLSDIKIPYRAIGSNVFVVESFKDSLNDIKKVIIGEIKKKKRLSQWQADRLSFMTHKGHGVRGFAVSQVEIGAGANYIIERLKQYDVEDPQEFLANSLTTFLQGAKLTGTREADILQKIITNYSQLVTTKGELRAEYISIVIYQYGHENSGRDATFERNLKRIFFEEFVPHVAKDLAQMRGSSTLEEKVLSVIIKQFKITIKPGKNGTLVLKIQNNVNPNTTKLKTSGVAKTENKKRSNTRLVKAKTPTNPRIRVGAGASIPDIRSLIGLLNQRLPGQVARNMESPALNYRTGRFASSVRVTDITPTSKGMPSVGFTYMKSPYQVFEYPGSGNPLAQRPYPGSRDPRALIDKSIREIMAEFMVGRFYTRRV